MKKQISWLKKNSVLTEMIVIDMYSIYSILFNHRSKQLIKDAIFENDFLKNLEPAQVREIVECMFSQSCDKGEFIIREGESGNALYVIAGKTSLILACSI